MTVYLASFLHFTASSKLLKFSAHAPLYPVHVISLWPHFLLTNSDGFVSWKQSCLGVLKSGRAMPEALLRGIRPNWPQAQPKLGIFVGCFFAGDEFLDVLYSGAKCLYCKNLITFLLFATRPCVYRRGRPVIGARPIISLGGNAILIIPKLSM